MSATLSIPARFHGPPGSANGGYIAGRLAALVDGEVVEVSLRAPPPLERELAVEPAEGGGVLLLEGEQVLAEGRAAELGLDAPDPVTPAAATEAGRRFPYREKHAFPTCFGCGPERAPGDGLRIFAGPVAGRDGLFAAPWIPDPSLADEDGRVGEEFVWAALDCSGGCRVANPDSVPPIVLGSLVARVVAPVQADETYVVTAWAGRDEGRKREAGTALHSADGELVAVGRALWVELR